MDMIYLDHHSTTPLDPRVLDTMMPFLTYSFANAGSPHRLGRQASAAVARAREQVANLIAAQSSEVFFTSGATESNNIVIQGVAQCLCEKGKHIITSKIEHPAVLLVCQALEKKGFAVTYLDVDSEGRVSAKDVAKNIRKDACGGTQKTILVSIMGANNEIGTIQPIAEIAKICSREQVLFHVDGAQYVGKLPVNVNELGIDFLSFSGHKIYAPKGIGGLYVKKSLLHSCCFPLMFGGGQEQALRPGTLPVFLIVALGMACELASKELLQRIEHETKLVKYLQDNLSFKIENTKVNGHPTQRLSGNLNMSFAGIDAEILMLRLKNIAVSVGSACSSQKNKSSYVLKAIGLSDDLAVATIRLGVGCSNTMQQMEQVVKEICFHVDKIRLCLTKTY